MHPATTPPRARLSRLSRPDGRPAGRGSGSAPKVLTTKEMGRALGMLYVSGASLALVWTFLPHPGTAGGAGTVRAMAAAAMLLGAVLLYGAALRHLTGPLVHAALAVIQVVIAVAYAAGRSPEGDVRLFFIWATPFAALYFPRRAAAAHGLWTTALLAAALGSMPAGTRTGAPAAFAMTSGCLVAVGVLVSWAAAKLRAAEADQRHAAAHDPLTGLANRAGFAEQAAVALARWGAVGGHLLVAVLDLDRFKLVNDTYGHAVGDRLLRQMAPRLRAAVGGEPVVARLGGDEFAVLCHDPSGRLTPEQLAARLAASWDEPVDLGCTQTYPSGSIGLTVAADPRCTAETLLGEADAAMYQAKAVGPGTWTLFDAELLTALARRVQIEERLRAAVAAGTGLSMVYQPVVELDTGRWVGAEALVRWQDAELGAVSPAEFVPVAEEAGLAVALGELVLEQVLAQLARWRAARALCEEFVLAVNVSARQLRPGFAAAVGAALRHWQVPAAQVALEVTETALLGEPAMVAREIDALHGLGVGLLLDDFGTGYSSLTHVRRFPISVIKVDRSFVSGEHAVGAQVDEAVVAAVVGLAGAVGCLVTAEGVETPAQREQLVALGCQLAQGWLFSRPLTADALVAGLAQHAPRPAAQPGAAVRAPAEATSTARYADLAALGLRHR